MLNLISSKLVHFSRVIRSSIHESAKKNTRSPHWRSVEKAALKASPECAACGGKEKLQVHHKAPFHLHPELELEPTNLIVLCMAEQCHAHLLVGHGNSFRAWVPNVETLAAQLHAEPARRDEIVAIAKATRKL